MMAQQAYGPYQVEDLLGDGGTGIVFRCVHRETGESVALKIPKGQGAQERDAVRREIGILGRMNRSGVRGVVRILDHGGYAGAPWYAMELLEGRSLRLWKEQLWSQNIQPRTTGAGSTMTLVHSPSAPPVLREVHEGRLVAPTAGVTASHPVSAASGQLTRVLNVVLRIAKILAQLHTEGVVHGDLTPSNVVFRDETDPVLIDFGMALAPLAPEAWRELPVSCPAGYGTPAYLAPEVLSGGTRDARCDLYALGCVIYELVTGSRPFSAASSDDILRQQLYATPAPPSRNVTGLPDGLEALILSLLEKDPVHRLARAEDVCEALSSYLPDQPKPFRRRWAPATLYRPRLHGREGQSAQLGAALEAMESGQGGFVLVAGPSGIGKTRLINELATSRPLRAGAPLWCRATGVSVPEAQRLSMPTEALGLFSPVLDRVLDEWRRSTDERAPEVAEALRLVTPLLPHLAGALNTPKNSGNLSTELTTKLAFEGLFLLLKHTAGKSGLLLLIDDLQWSDELSSSFLRRYARDLSTVPVLVVASYRTDDTMVPANSDLMASASLYIDLSPLGVNETTRIARDILATDALPAGLLSFLYKYSRGNPFFIAEYVRAAVSKRLLERTASGRWLFDIDRSNDLTIPGSIEGLLQLRILQLSERSRRALQQACVLGRDFDADCFQTLVGPAMAPSELLEELVAREILELTSPGRYRFVHDALREVQERALSTDERHSYHRIAATQLELSGYKDDEDRAGTLGYHWACAGEARKALGYLAVAASAAQTSHALDRAGELYRLSIKQCDLLDAGNPDWTTRARLLEALADVLIQQARHDEARHRLRQLLDILPTDQQLARARTWRKLAASHWTVHDYPSAALALDEAELQMSEKTVALNLQHYSELIEIGLGRFEQLYFSGDVGPTLEALITRLGPLIEEHGSNDQSCFYYFMTASHVMLKRRYAFDETALELAERGLAAARSLAPQRLAMALFILAYALTLGSREQCRLALSHFEHAAREAERVGEATLLSRIRTYHAIALLRVGDIDATNAAAELALEAARAANLQPYMGAACVCQGWAAWRKGDEQRASSLLQVGRDCWRSSAHGFPFSNLALFPLLDCAYRADDFETAKALLREFDAGLPALPGVLDAAIRESVQVIEQAPPQEASRALARVLLLASEHAFS